MARLKYPIIVMGLFAIMWLAGYIIFLARVMTAEIEKPGQKSDAIIVLTGGTKRIATGFELLQNGRADLLLISGVDRNVSRDELFLRHDVPQKLRACCVTLGRKAQNTPGNAREAYDWIQLHKINKLRLVTSNYHIDRARLEFKHQMPDIRINTHPVRPADLNVGHAYFWRLTFEEYHKLLYRFGFHTLKQVSEDWYQGAAAS